MKITTVFAKPKFLFIFILAALISTVFYLLLTGIYVVSLGEFIENPEPLRVFLTLLISTLTALAITLALYKQEQPLVCSQNAPAFLGGLLALFTTGCPVCFPVILSAAGISGATALAVSSNAVPIQLASLALLSASIYYTTR